MTDGAEKVRERFEQVEYIDQELDDSQNDGPLAPTSGESRGDSSSDDSADKAAGGDYDGGQGGGVVGSTLPPDFPVQPLGQVGSKFYFLTARGELRELSAGALSYRSNLVELMVGAKDPLKVLGEIAPAEGKRDIGFNASAAADKLMQACAELPLFDQSMPMRHFGTWRAETSVPVVHLGEKVLASAKEDRRGRKIGRALYPAVPSRSAPGDTPAAAADIEWVRERIARFWNWRAADSADLVIGWIGQAALGHYPDWRTHMWIKGKHGSGKSTLIEIISSLLGGMSPGVKNSTSAAAMRQTTNRMAVARIFDEAEKKDEVGGGVEEVIALFRLMSGSEGAQVERGTSDHSGIRFELYGAGLLGSIIPGGMAPQDQSRFILVALNARKEVENPEDAAMLLDELQRDAKELGPHVWRRMLDLAPSRWDRTFRIYSSTVQSLGGASRAGDTIGAILAGWDLMLFDTPLACPESGEIDQERMARAKEMAQPLISQTKEADEEGEGERFLRTLFGAQLNKDHGGVATVEEQLYYLQDALHDPAPSDQKLIARGGLRLLKGERGKRDLFIANGENPLLNQALRGTRWRGGGHRAALETIPDVRPSDKPVRVAGSARRGMVVPARFLPGIEEDPASHGGSK